MRVFLHTLGCKANQYDTELVRQAIEDAGSEVVDDWRRADASVINSCTVTHVAEAKMRGLVRRIARDRGGIRTVVMGCAAAVDDGSIATLPGVVRVVGGNDTRQVLDALELPFIATPLRSFARDGRGWLKIQDGCDEHCTFCATTLARGVNRSRSVEELVEEARALAEHHAEIVLTGVHIGTYGQDVRRVARGVTLGGLLEALIDAVPSVRFRLGSVEATEVDDTLARLLIEAPRNLAAHLHAPLQSGSNRVLKRMGRHWYTAESYRARIDWLAERLPVFGLGADVIAGFPGETPQDHEGTLRLLDALPFSYLHVFPFSVRPDAPAARLSGQLSPAVIRDRARELRELGEIKSAAYRGRRRGQTADGVVSGRQQGRLEVMTEDYLSVYLDTDLWDGRPRFEVTVN